MIVLPTHEKRPPAHLGQDTACGRQQGTVVGCKLWPCDLALEHVELVAQNYDFDLLGVVGAKSKND
jgi:hypothetical protein